MAKIDLLRSKQTALAEGSREAREYVIAVSQPNGDAISETFIRSDISEFRRYADVHNLTCGWLPRFANGAPLLPWYAAAWDRVAVRLLGGSRNQEPLRRAVRKYLVKHRVQLVLACFGPAGVAMSTVCRQVGVPLVVHFYGADATSRTVLEQYRSGYESMFRDARGVIAISKHQMAVLRSLGCPADKIHYGVCGAAPLFTENRSRFDEKLFLAVGRLTPKKAPHKTIQAFAAVNRIMPESQLFVVGEGELESECRASIQRFGLQNSVRLLGALPHKKVAALMQDAYCFVQHSVTAANGDTEGTPIAVIEASMAGIPVVATRHAGIPDVVLDGETGFLVEENDVSSMAERMLRLATDPALAVRLGQRGFEHVHANFALEETAARKWLILKECILKQ